MDKRELIIERLVELAAGVSGVTTVIRNRTEFDETQLPAIAILEGDEDVSDSDEPRGRPSARPYLVTATPLVYIRSDGSTTGTTLNAIRAEVIKAVIEDND